MPSPQLAPESQLPTQGTLPGTAPDTGAADFGAGIDTGAAAAQQQVVQQQPSAVVKFFEQYGVDPNSSEDDVRAAIDRMQAENEIVAKHLGDGVNEQRLQQLLEAEARYQQIAPKLTDYDKWLQSQQQAAQQQQVAPHTSLLPAIDEPSATDYTLAHANPQTGRYEPIVPNSGDCLAAADRLNKYERAVGERLRRLGARPEEVFQPLFDPVQKRIDALEKLIQQQGAQSTQQQEWNNFMAQHGGDLQSFDVTKGEWVPNQAGVVFQQKLEEFAKRGLADKDARELALQFAQAATNSAVVGTGQQPAVPQVPASQPFARRLARAPRPTDVAGRVQTQPAADEPAFDLSLGIEGIFDQAQQRATAKMLGK